MLLIARLISSAAEGSDGESARAGKGGDARWEGAAAAARAALAREMPQATEGAAAWARGMNGLTSSVSGYYSSAVGGGGGGGGGATTFTGDSPISEPLTAVTSASTLVDSVVLPSSDGGGAPAPVNASLPTFEIAAPENSRRGMHLGLLVALTASWTQGRGGLLPIDKGGSAGGADADGGGTSGAGDPSLSGFLDSDDDWDLQRRPAALPVGVKAGAELAALSAIRLEPITAALSDAMSALASLASSLGVLGWAVDGAPANQQQLNGSHPGLHP
jgi:hypothetical protein